MEAKLKQLRELVERYEEMARGRLGVSGVGLAIHQKLDEITSEVYGQTFAYCGREHRVV